MNKLTPMHRIMAEVTGWPGVKASTGERGEFSFRLHGREIGHLHGNGVAHFAFPRDVGSELRQSGRVGPHPVAPQSVKWAARGMETDGDVEDVIALMRLNYERLADQDARRAQAAGAARRDTGDT